MDNIYVNQLNLFIMTNLLETLQAIGNAAALAIRS